ncbi:MAG: hypothetical protein KC416_02075 [Myxococcales bacterium]|nr:hypothetical protein [Myxococcales bacterium]
MTTASSLGAADFHDDVAAIGFLRDNLARMATNIGNRQYDLPDLDRHLSWLMYVGDINVFSLSNSRAFHFVSTHTAELLGYRTPQEVIDAGSFSIMTKHYRKLECIYWVKHLLQLPKNHGPKPIDYVARTKVLQKNGRYGFVEHRYLACNLPNYRTPYDIVCMACDPRHLHREACCFAVATHPDPRIRERTGDVHRLCTGKRRWQVFLLRGRKWSPARIAERLEISTDVVNEHLTEIYRIFNFRDRKLERLIDFARRSGLHASPFLKDVDGGPYGGVTTS